MEQLARGRGLALAGRLAEAAAALAEAAGVAPGWAEPRLLLGLCESQLGRSDAALASLAAALDLAGPTPARREQSAEHMTAEQWAELRATALFERGNVHVRVGRPAEAMAAYGAVLALQPQHAHAYSNVGVVHYGAARYSEAARRFGAATQLHPRFADAYQHHGAALKALGALEEAYASYEHAAGLVGAASSEPLRGMALVERERGRLPQALKLLAAATAIAPAATQLHLDRGVVHDYAEDRLAAIAAYTEALRLAPAGVPQATYFRGRAAKSICLWRGWELQMRSVRAALRAEGGATAMGIDPVASLSYPFSAAELLVVAREALAFKLSLTAPAAAPRRRAEHAPPLALRAGGERLRVGLVSSYFRDHNLLRLCRGLFLRADATRVALHLFAESDDDRSALLREVQAAPAVASFTRIRGTPTEAAVGALRAARLHVAINLNGHHWNAASEAVRFPLFLHGAAPVQAAYMGYPGPNGARFLHHTYVDALVAPVRRAAVSFTERLALLPHSYYLSDYAASHRALLEPPSPSADALPRSTPLLCSLNQLPKLDPALFATWLNALSRAAASPGPPARLWLLRFPLSAIVHLRAEAAAHTSAVPAAAMIDLPTVAYEARPVYVWCAYGVRMVCVWCAHGVRVVDRCTCAARRTATSSSTRGCATRTPPPRTRCGPARHSTPLLAPPRTT